MKLFSTILIFLLFGAVSSYAQQYSTSQLDSLYNKFTATFNYTGGHHEGIQSVPEHGKCGFGLVSEVKFNYRYFSAAQKKVLKILLSRPSTDTSFVSPNGFFRIHFTKSDFPDYIPSALRSGIPASEMQSYKNKYLDSLAIALDSAYNFEVNYLGYPPPPPDGNAGGDDKYDIYIVSMNDYGSTYPDSEISSTPTYTSYMEIADDYSGFNTDGINAARVTVAHEFHHSIQIGNYIYRYDEDAYFYELTSTSMEHFVYPSIHDYYQYLPSYFYETQNCFTQNGTNQEYALAIWNIFLKDKFGYGIIKKQWELMPHMRAIKAISNSLVDYNTSFGTEFSNFGIWTFYTSYRSIMGKYFEDAAGYPVVRPMSSIKFLSPLDIKGYTEPLTNTFISVDNPSSSSNVPSDSLMIIITNSDIAAGISAKNTSNYFEYNLYSSQNSGSALLTNNYYYSFNSDKPAFWLTGALLNNQVVVNGKTGISNSNFVYPSPFSYTNNYYLYIPVTYNSTGQAELYVYNVAMKRVYSGSKGINNSAGKLVLVWNAMDSNNEKLATGVYIYVVKSGDKITKGKLVILNE